MPDLGTATILRADARALPLRDNTVDLVVTSPPYFGLRSYQDDGEHYAGQIGAEPTPAEFVDALLDVTRECTRVLKPSGSMWVNLGDKYVADNRGSGGDRKRGKAKHAPRGAAGYVGKGILPRKSLMGLPWRYALRCIDDLGLILRAEIIWDKPNGLPESVTDRVRRSHEQWFHFTLEPRYFSAVDEIREQYEPSTISRNRYAVKSHTPASYTDVSRGVIRDDREAGHEVNPLGKLPGSVWNIPTEPLRVPDDLGVDHFAAFPSEWPKRIIQGWSPEGGTVLDPFGGTGTTAMVAKALGRHGISVDMSSDYCRLAGWRTNDRDQLAKVLGVGKAEKQPAEQGDLLALLSGAEEVTT